MKIKFGLSACFSQIPEIEVDISDIISDEEFNTFLNDLRNSNGYSTTSYIINGERFKCIPSNYSQNILNKITNKVKNW